MNIPQQIPGTTEEVSVEWILANLAGFIDLDADVDDWMGMIQYKAFDLSTAVLIDRYLNGGFTVPVCLYEHCGDGRYSLGNGHHRMTAAILTCADTIPVYWSEDGDYMHSESTEENEYGWYSECIPEAMTQGALGIHEALREWRLFA